MKPLNETFRFDLLHSNYYPYHDQERMCAVGGEKIFCFIKLYYATVVYKVDYDAKRADWQWTIPIIDTNHRLSWDRKGNYYFAGTSFYRGINIDKNARYASPQDTGVALSLWQLDPRMRSWFQTWHPFAPLWTSKATYSTMNGSVFVVYSSLQWSPPSVRHHVDINNNTAAIWLFDTTIRRWTLCLERSNQSKVPTPRISSTMVDMENGSLLLFGEVDIIAIVIFLVSLARTLMIYGEGTCVIRKTICH